MNKFPEIDAHLRNSMYMNREDHVAGLSLCNLNTAKPCDIELQIWNYFKLQNKGGSYYANVNG